LALVRVGVAELASIVVLLWLFGSAHLLLLVNLHEVHDWLGHLAFLNVEITDRRLATLEP